jgi:hypothetical protein
MQSIRKFVVPFHGNCTDGAISAYLFYMRFGREAYIEMYPVSPSDKRTWPMGQSVIGAELVLLDVTPPADLMAFYRSACPSITIIDHHPAAAEVAGGCCAVLSSDRCAAWLTHEYLFPGVPIPDWLQSVDRVDRWTGVTEADQQLREVLHPIAKLAVSHGFLHAFAGITRVIQELTRTAESAAAIYAEGKYLLDKKQASLDQVLEESHHLIIEVDAEYSSAWNLPAEWLGYNMFVIETSGMIDFDTTASSQRVFDKYAGIDIFLNYRLITWHSGSKYAFHARARDGSAIDLTRCPHLKGHPSAAGGQRNVDGKVMPFVLDQEPVEELEASVAETMVAMSNM